MLLTVFVYAAVVNFSPVYSTSNNVSRNKRSDDFVPCEKGWYYFQEKCYKVLGRKKSDRQTWDRASERCKNIGGDLVTIQSQEEQDFIIAFLLLDVKYFVWIGLHDRVNESIYQWNDGSVVNYTNWNAMEPTGIKDEKEDCVQLLFEPENDVIGKWNDNSCGNTDPFICQMKPNPKKKSPNSMYCFSDVDRGWKFQNSCYHIVTEMKSWKNAENHCNDIYNGHLVTILDMAVDLFLDKVLLNIKKELWIGIKIQDQLQQKWSSGWYVSYDGFDKNMGNFIEGTCVVRKNRREWITVPCKKKYSFICETSTVSPPVLKLPVRGSHCPGELDDWRDLGGEYCYHIETTKSFSWYQSNFECKRRGGHLMSLHSEEENKMLQPFVKYVRKSIHIGLFRLLAHEEHFAWTDGSAVDFESWGHDEPNNEEEKCVEVFTHDMKWNDENCGDSRGYICSVKKIPPNMTALEGIDECSGYISIKVLIGVTVCILVVIILLGVVVYCFKPWDLENRKQSTAVPTIPPSPPSKRARYRSTTELTGREEEHYEMMR